MNFARMRRWILCGLLATGVVLLGCKKPETPAPAAAGGVPQAEVIPPRPPAVPVPASPAWSDATKETGLDFIHHNGMSGQWYMPEMVGPGAALFDFDGDGDLDLFIVQGTKLAPDSPLPGPPAATAGHGWHHRLYRNDLNPNTAPAQVRWVDISAAAGLKDLPSDYGMGVAVGDYDNDGWPDLYLGNLGPNRLLRNDGGKRFVDVTEAAGGNLGDPHWSTSATWFDFDRDGHLDLFACNYIDFTFDRHRQCLTKTGSPDYCGPTVYPHLTDRLWRNQGDGTFEDVSGLAGLLGRAGAALGVVAADFDLDGWPDLLVANDGMANFLWLNQRDGTFKESALERGVAFNGMGASEANMGVVAADFDEDGDDDIVITHLDGEKNTLWENWDRGWFSDITAAAGMDGPTRAFTGFGLVAADFNLDGWLDLLSANGAVRVNEAQRKAGVELPMLQHAQLFLGLPKARFTEVTNVPALRVPEIGRGLALGDVDNDGDLDAVFANNHGPARLVLNRADGSAAWAGFDLRLPKQGGRSAHGATILVELSDGRTLHRRCASDGSYASALDPRVVFGLGSAGATVKTVRVRWPDGRQEQWEGRAAGSYHVLAPGTGSVLGSPP